MANSTRNSTKSGAKTKRKTAPKTGKKATQKAPQKQAKNDSEKKPKKPVPINPELTDAGTPRKGTAGARLGWHKKDAKNIDIREAMASKGIGQVTLARIIEMNPKSIWRLLNSDLPDNIRYALLESIEAYDPVTNPHGIFKMRIVPENPEK